MAKVTNPNRYTPEEIRVKLLSSDLWLYRALKRLYTYQTDPEKNSGLTKERNDVGFNAVDSASLTKYAKALNDRGWLAIDQHRHARKLMVKYAGQLARIARDKPDGLK